MEHVISGEWHSGHGNFPQHPTLSIEKTQ